MTKRTCFNWKIRPSLSTQFLFSRHTYILIVYLCIIVVRVNAQSIELTKLTVEGRTNLLGLDKQHPRLSWQIKSADRGIKQKAYQIIVTSSLAQLETGNGLLWNSGKVLSDASLNISYTGDSLHSYQNYFWKVKIWTSKGIEVTSKPEKWTMAILKSNEWKAKWIGLDTCNANDRPRDNYTRLAARYLRKKIQVAKTIKSATAFISGLGLYELYINGQKAGNDVLAPTVKEYNKVIPYNTLDITNLIKKGANGIGVILGNGRFFAMRNYRGNEEWLTGIPPVTNYGYPMLLIQIRIDYRDGSHEFVVSDKSWKVTDNGPIIANNEFDGEEYDANKEMNNWANANFNDTDWKQVDIMYQPARRMESQLNENIVVKEKIQPLSIMKTTNGSYIIDMGQNMVGWLAIKVKGNKGDTLKMVFAEKLKGKDSLYLANIRNAKVTDKYILKGTSREEWEPRFSYHGFRYVEISGLTYMPSVNDFIGKVIYDDIVTTGTFTSSNTTLNSVFTAAYWTIRGNYRGMPTDCPQRDERMGWLGDRSINSYGESFLFDNSRLYAKWINDIKETQKENGSISDVAPSYWKFYRDNVTWPSSFIIIPEILRKQFGDNNSYRENYPNMKKWILYMWNTYRIDDLILKDNYGDHCLPPESLDIIVSKDPSRNTKGELLASSYFYYCLQLMKQYAASLGFTNDVKEYEEIRSKVYVAFNKRFYHIDSMYYANNTVTSNLLPLAFGLTPEKDRAQIFRKIVDRTVNMYNNHVSTGLIGEQWLMRGLSENGRPDIAYTIATNNTYPSWGYMIKEGSTTIWELWNGNTANPAMNSGNHVMLLGDLMVWYYEYLAGIKTDPVEIAFKRIIMNPYIPCDLNFVNASYKSVYGLIKSYWRKEADNFIWEISIPANTTAVVYIPSGVENKILENGKPIKESFGIKFIKFENDKSVFEFQSGNYLLQTKLIY